MNLLGSAVRQTGRNTTVGGTAARPSDWAALNLDADPTPGDPDILISVADYMDNMATNAQTADTGLSQVVAKTGDGAFVGKTADWLRKQVTTEMQGFLA